MSVAIDAAAMGSARVRLIVTGGTLDKIHDWRNETIAFADHGRSVVPDILAEARCDFPVIETLFFKDSLDFTDADRAAVADAIARAPEDRFVVTHGTSTMDVTARALAARALGKTIVLTGAMRPYSLSRSDAPFNLGSALVAAQLLPPGVYGAMNGRVFPADALAKNVEAGRFDR